MPFSLIFFDYDGVLIDSLGDAISVGGDFCRSISHDRVPTKETIGALDIMTYYELDAFINSQYLDSNRTVQSPY